MAEAFESEGASSPRDIRRKGNLKIDMGRICCVRRVVNLRWLMEVKAEKTLRVGANPNVAELLVWQGTFTFTEQQSHLRLTEELWC